MQDINKISFKLLETWCDSLCKLQVTQRKSKGVYGGILCDACAFIHGRCSDAVYPMVAMYEQTGDEKYLNCAKLLIQWHDNNLKSNSGYYFNDSFTTWRCTTLFYIIALCETLFDFGEALPQDLREQWTKDIVRMSAPLENDGIFFPPKDGSMPSVINYPVAYLTAMAAVGVLTGEQRYFTLAKKQEDNILSFVTESGWLFGENLDRKVSPMGIRGIDLGYNIEESIVNLALYGKYAKSEKFLSLAEKMLNNAADFILPDGGVDNSWGTRAVKWTYYGSRTSDGCQIACSILQDRNPIFAEMAARNILLYKKMTVDGLLMGGYMYNKMGYESCVHHTFCHAKALAYLIKHPLKATQGIKLPRETQKGFKTLPESGVTLISKGNWRATMQNCDVELIARQEISGGAPTLVYHMEAGPLFVGNGVSFQLPEPTNMQVPRDAHLPLCQTVRISANDYTSQYCKCADVSCREDGELFHYSAKGLLTHKNGKTSATYRIFYSFKDNEFKITASCEEDATLWLPIICEPDTKVDLATSALSFVVNSHTVTLKSSVPLNFLTCYERGRMFNTTGGFCTLPVTVDLAKQEMVDISISVKN